MKINTVATLCTQLGLPLHHGSQEDCDRLSLWCNQHISRDISYDGDLDSVYSRYLNLAREFLEDFLPTAASDDRLLHAARQGYDHFITAAVVEKNNLWNKPDAAGFTPLHLAARHGHVETTKALLARGADPTVLDTNQEAPLFSALWIPMRHEADLIKKKEQVFSLLLQEAPSVMEQQNNSGDTVCHLMAAMGLTGLLKKTLAQYPEKIACRNNHTHYLIHVAILNGHSEIAQLLLKHAEVATQVDVNLRTPLHYAVLTGDSQLLGACLHATKMVDPPDKQHQTPLMLAVQADQFDAVKQLIQYGANATLVDESGYSALDYAKPNPTLFNWLKNHI